MIKERKELYQVCNNEVVNDGDYQEEVLGLVKDLKHVLTLLFQRETPFLRLHQAKYINQIAIHDNFTNT